MNSMQAKVKEFHNTFMGDDPPGPMIPDARVQALRMRLIHEETHEFQQASAAGDLAGSIKELCDLLYVVLGAANAYGVDIEPFFDEVHRSNMTKRWPDGTIHKNEHGKVLKPPTYSPANVEALLAAITPTDGAAAHNHA